MNTEHGYRKQVESHHQGSRHTLAILMSKLRSSLGAAWEQARTSLRLASDDITARPSRTYGSSVTILRLVVSMLLLLIVGTGNVWGQVTYQYYAIHNKDNGYLKQVNGAVAVDKTFRYENSHDANGFSIWVLSSDGYLQQEMYYLNVANDQTLYLSTEKVTQWTIDNTTATGKNYLKPNGSSKFLCADSGPQLKDSPSKYLNACEMTIAENGDKWEGPKDVSFTVQSPQLVTYLRTYYVHNIIATITKDDAGNTNSKVVDKKDSRCYCSLTYSTTTDANKGTNWDINETSGVIYSKQASGDYSVAATYSVAPLDPIALSNHPATNQTVTLKLQPLPFTPDAAKNYLLFNTKEENYRFPYDDGLSENDAVKTNANKSALTEPLTSPNSNISWKIVRDDDGFYSFRNVTSGRWLRYDGSHYVDGSDYGVIEMGVNDDATPAGNEYKFRLYKSGTYKYTDKAPTYCILPYSKQYAVYKSDGLATNALVALSVYTTPKVISLGKAGDDSKYCIFAYEAEYRIYGGFTLSGPTSALSTGDYVFKTTQSYSSRNIVNSPNNTRDLEINGSYSVADISFSWDVQGHDGYITKQTPTVSQGAGTEIVTVNSLPSGARFGKVRVQAKSGSSTGGINGENNQKWSGWKELEFNLYGEPSYTDITSLSEITSSDGYYRLTADVSDAPGVTEFSGFLDGNMHKISSVSAPLFTTLTGTVKNIILDGVNISSHTGNTGAIACTANGAARIYNVGILSGSVSGTGYTGGLVGLLDGTARVINCYSYANITGGTTVGGIVGYNNVATTATNLKTMVMNCMFYGDITGGTTKSPVYGGKNINNIQGGLNTFNYYSYENLTGGVTDNQYNCALAVEEKYLNRFEYYRLLLNSNKKLAAYYATGSADNGDKMAKWVLETADRTIDNPKPYPVLKAQGYYPSIINPDIEHAPDSASVGRNHGGKLGKTLTVHIGGVGSNAPGGASIRVRGAIQLQRTDKDFDRFNFNYDKVQLPYYNDVGTGNYTDNKVVTGWKITAITAVPNDPYTSENYPTTGITDYPNHNYADRKSSNKDLYSVSKRVFSQGAYFDVPYGVTSITIEPYWGNAIYVADQYYDVVYKTDYSGKQGVSQVGTQAVDNTTEFNGQKVRTSITGLSSAETVYDNAVVLVGNLHLDNVPSGGDIPFTMMSVDQDNDHEPDYSLIYHHKSRVAICPIRFDFLNIPGTAQAQKPNGASLICNFTIFKTKGWFEVTNTSSFYSSQLEYENKTSITKTDAPLILLGGVIDQFVSTQSTKVDGKTIYIHVGSNVWINEFGMGTHSDGSESTPHVPVSVTGGEFPGFYLTGTYKADAQVRTDNAECYISGGYFHEVAGASLEQIDGNVRWQIYNADIDNFFGGGINDAKPITGNVTTDIYNSHVTLFCGGPKFGNMQANKNVTTNAEGCTFGKFFGAGYGGTSIAKKKYYDLDTYNWTTLQGYYTTDRGKYFDGITTKSSYVSGKDYGKKGPGVATDFEYEFFVWTSGATGARLYVNFAAFSLAQCNDVSSTLKNCTVETNFYGGGNLGKVVGTATSVLEDCTVKGSVYGAGYSASLPTVEVRDAGFTKDPNYNSQSGMFEPGVFSGTTTFTWQNAAAAGKTLTNGQSGSDLSNHILYTNTVLTGLGEVAKSVLTINGTTTVAHSVYGGGEESGVAGNTEVTVTGGTIGTANEGGAEYGNVYGGGKGKEKDVTAGLVKGNATVSISGSPTILHNVYGGGAYGSVGDFTYDPTSGMPTACAENTGNTQVTITGGTFGTDGHENGMVFGSSRGDVAVPEGEPAVDPNDRMAWVNSTHVIIGTQSDDPSKTNPSIAGSVYGSGENGHTFKDTQLDIHSGRIGLTEEKSTDPVGQKGAKYPYRGNVYGGGCGTDMYWNDANGNDVRDPGEEHYNAIAGIVRGNATVTIDGGHVVHNVYGAGAMGSVGNATDATSGKTTVTIKGKAQIGVEDISGNIYGAARGDQSVDEESFATVRTTQLEVSGNADIKGSVFGGGSLGLVKESTIIDVKGGSVHQSVYGGGSEANVMGNTTVTMTDGYIFNGIFGGGLSGSVGTFTRSTEPEVVNIFGHTTHAGCIGKPTACAENTGKCTIVVSGGQIGPIEVATRGMNRLDAEGGPVPEGWVWGGGRGLVESPSENPDVHFTAYVNETDVTIKDNAFILESIIGGGEFGRVLGNTNVKIEGGQIGVGADQTEGDKPKRYTDEQFVNPSEITDENALVPCSHYPYGKTVGTTTVYETYDPYADEYKQAHGGTLPTGLEGGSTDNASDGKTWIGCVFGGGSGYFPYKETDTSGKITGYGWVESAGFVEGDANLTISGGHILSNVYGANEYTTVQGKSTVTMTGGTIGVPRTQEQIAADPKIGHLFGGGKGDPRPYFKNKTNAGSVEVAVSGGIIYGSVFGGGESGTVKGGVTVTMTGGTVLNDVYGGGALADTQTNNWDETKNSGAGDWAEGKTSASNTTLVRLTGGDILGEAYGGGLGETGKPAFVWGDVLLDLNGTTASGEEGAAIAVNKKGCTVNQVFGCNNAAGTPMGKVLVHVYATQNKGKANISTKPDKKTNTYDVMAVYGGGNLAAYEPAGGKTTTNSTNVIIDGCALTSIKQVYGGGNAASTPATKVTVNGTYEVEELFGGGNGKDNLPNGDPNPGANVGFYTYADNAGNAQTPADRAANYGYGSGQASLNVFGGTIHRVFGGSNTKGNVRQTAVTLLDENSGCEFCVDEAYGGGKSAPMDAEAKLLMACIPGLQAAYGGAEAAAIQGNVTLNITNGTFDRVFGGNNLSGTINGSITVNVEEIGCKPIKIGELYGGGNEAGYSVYGYDSDGKPVESGTTPLYDDPQVNVMSFTSIGNIYGGGYGEGATMVGNPTVNINEAYGRYYDNTSGNTSSVVDENAETPNHYPIPSHAAGKMGAINNVFGGGNAAKVIGNPTVNIGTLSEVYVVKEVTSGTALPTGCYTRNNDGTYSAATGTAQDGVTYYEKKDVQGADIRGNVYGGGNNAEVTGNTNVVIGKKNENQ